MKDDPIFNDIVKQITKYNMDEDEYYRMEVAETMFWTYEDELKFQRMEAYEEGEKRGEKRGRKQGEKQGEKIGIMKTVKKMIDENLSLDLITKVTGLSKSEIEKYQKN